MKFYKIRHIPTGLFFKPTTTGYIHTTWDETHLSLNGKVYQKRPSWNYVSAGFTLPAHEKFYKKEDFEIVEIETKIVAQWKF